MAQQFTYLPYFQFKPSDWLTGDIQYCSLESKGLFSDICAFYWQRKCTMTQVELYKKFQHEKLLEELIHQEVIKIEDGDVVIEFLLDQFELLHKVHKRNVSNGRKGAVVRKQNQEQKKEEPLPGFILSSVEKQETEGVFFRIGMTLHRTNVSDYVKNEMKIHTDQFMMTMKPVTIDQVLKQMDTDYLGYSFNNHNHVIKAFDKIARDLKNGKGSSFNKTEPSTKLSYSIGKKA
jgi:hypothetical protein